VKLFVCLFTRIMGALMTKIIAPLHNIQYEMFINRKLCMFFYIGWLLYSPLVGFRLGIAASRLPTSTVRLVSWVKLEMYTWYKTVHILSSTYQKLLKLMGIWRSSDTNSLCSLFWDTVYFICFLSVWNLIYITYITLFLTKNFGFTTKSSSLRPFFSQLVLCLTSNNSTS